MSRGRHAGNGNGPLGHEAIVPSRTRLRNPTVVGVAADVTIGVGRLIAVDRQSAAQDLDELASVYQVGAEAGSEGSVGIPACRIAQIASEASAALRPSLGASLVSEIASTALPCPHQRQLTSSTTSSRSTSSLISSSPPTL
jgi:hypothetical protein